VDFDPIKIAQSKDYPRSKKLKYLEMILMQIVNSVSLIGSFITMVKSG